jgi:hypothetical protein
VPVVSVAACLGGDVAMFGEGKAGDGESHPLHLSEDDAEVL